MKRKSSDNCKRVLLALALGLAISSANADGKYRFLAFNIWGDFFGNPVHERDLQQLEIVKGHDPDFIGLQEVTPRFWKSRLISGLAEAGYERVGDEMGPNEEHRVAANPVFFRKSRFELVEKGSKWFHPELDFSKGVVWAVVRERSTGRKFVVFASHFWWQTNGKADDYLRLTNARMLHEAVSEAARRHGAAVVGGGDLNSPVTSSALAELKKLGWCDAQEMSPETDPRATWRDFPKRDASGVYRGVQPENANAKMWLDHVFYAPEAVRPVRFSMDRSQRALDVSDHSPVIFDFTILHRNSEVYRADKRVEYRDCPKCDKRIRVDLAAGKAYVNLSRLEGTDREVVAARASKLLDAAKTPPASDPKIRPLMGWSSWNTFGVAISEEIILGTARAMATNGLKDAGYTYVNIDDGFFWGHGDDGVLRFHPDRFPNGMKPVVDGIHALGLRAGIYSDAGADTCGSIWAGPDGKRDQGGVGGGLYGHDAADCKLHFNELGFDFIKVDYCGGIKLKLNEKDRYTEIANAIKATGRTDVRLNLCRWAFPGTWAADIAESWRTTGDICANWGSVKKIIGENLYLSAYSKPGHYNDMDMLEVGQLVGQVKSVFGKSVDTGLTHDEETTHFGMWCMLSSPLLIGCDVRSIPASSKALITNPYLLAMNQNDLGLQGYVVAKDGEAYILVKDAVEKFGKSRYVALYNGSDKAHDFTVRSSDLDLGGKIDAFDLVEMADVGCFEGHVSVNVAPHASKFYRFDAERRGQRRVYEAECAYLADYQELDERFERKLGTAAPAPMEGASGGMVVVKLGSRASNFLEWRDVKVDAAGKYVFAIDYSSSDDRSFDFAVDGGTAIRVAAKGTGGKLSKVNVSGKLSAGVHTVRLSNAAAWMPDVDRMTLAPR